MLTFRIPFYENRPYKEYLKTADFQKIAPIAIKNNLDKKNVNISEVRQIDADTIEIYKRVPKKKGLLYELGLPQKGIFERIVINRKTSEVSIDRMDSDIKRKVPYLGRRDLFFYDIEKEKVCFVRHNEWIHKIYRPYESFLFQRAFRKYNRMFT